MAISSSSSLEVLSRFYGARYVRNRLADGLAAERHQRQPGNPHPYVSLCHLALLIRHSFAVVKRRGVFDAGQTQTEIDRLTGSIKVDVQRLSGQLDGLQAYVDARKQEAQRVGAVPGRPLQQPLQSSARGGGLQNGGPNNSSTSGSNDASGDVLSSVQGLSHSDVVLSSLKTQLLSFSITLKDALSQRGEGMKAAADRRQVFGRAAGKDLGRPLALYSPHQQHQQQHSQQQQGRPGSGSVGGDAVISIGGGGSADAEGPFKGRRMGGSNPSSSAGAGGIVTQFNQSPYGHQAGSSGIGAGIPSHMHSVDVKQQRGGGYGAGAGAGSAADAFQLVTQAQLEPELQYLQNRSQDVRAVESAISDISTLFGRLAHLVAEQGAQIERIDGDLESASECSVLADAQLSTHVMSLCRSTRMLPFFVPCPREFLSSTSPTSRPLSILGAIQSHLQP